MAEKVNGWYYRLASSNARPGGLTLSRSRNGIDNWEPAGSIFKPNEWPDWLHKPVLGVDRSELARNQAALWAPECHVVRFRQGGRTVKQYVIYYTGRDVNGELCIGRVMSRDFKKWTDLGPLVRGKDVAGPDGEVVGQIDSTLVEVNGRKFLCWKRDANSPDVKVDKNTYFFVRELTDDGLNFVPNTPVKVVLTNSRPEERGLIEGPSFWRRATLADHFFGLTRWLLPPSARARIGESPLYTAYSSGWFSNHRYTTWTARTRPGDFPGQMMEKFPEPMVETGPISRDAPRLIGPGHGTARVIEGEQMFDYHVIERWTGRHDGDRPQPHAFRAHAMDRIRYRRDGSPVIDDGRPSDQPQVKPGVGRRLAGQTAVLPKPAVESEEEKQREKALEQSAPIRRANEK
jgi:hypothetical protein